MIKYRLIIFLLILLSIPAFSQDTLRINFKDAVRLALDNNVALRRENNNLESSLATRKETKALYAPGVSGYVGASRLNGQQFDQVTGQVFRDNTELSNYQVGARYVLFDGLNRKFTNRQSQSQLESQQYMVDRTRQDIIYNVGAQFLQVLMDKELLRIARKNFEVQGTTLRQIKGFVEAGTRPLSDQLDQEAAVSQIEVEVIRAENNLRLDKARLTRTLFLEPGLEIDPNDPDWSLEALMIQNYDLDSLYEMAMAFRPDYKMALANQEAANSGIQMANSGYLPSLELFGGVGSSFTSQLKDPNNPTETMPFTDQFENNGVINYGLDINIPIYQRNTTVARKTRAKMAYENAKLVEEDLRLLIFREVQTAYFDFLAAKNEYRAAEKQFKAAEQAYTIQNERYEVGVGNLVELSRSTWTFVDAAASRAQARYTLLFQKVILDYFTGILNQDGLL